MLEKIHHKDDWIPPPTLHTKTHDSEKLLQDELKQAEESF